MALFLKLDFMSDPRIDDDNQIIFETYHTEALFVAQVDSGGSANYTSN